MLNRNIFKNIKRSYHSNLLKHYENPKNIGSLNSKDINVGTGLVGAPACGDVMKLNIRVNEKGIIIPPVSDYSVEIFGEDIIGKTIYETLLRDVNKDYAGIV